MKTITAKDIMVPLDEYATVSHRASLLEAIRALENPRKKHGDEPYRHISVLVLNDKGKVIGKVSQTDIMKAMEPNYKKIGNDLILSRFGFSAAFVKAMQNEFKLWERPLKELCVAAEKVKVKEVMYTPADHQRVSENDTLDTAMHQIVIGQHHSLLVTDNKGKQIVGILRATDVFNSLCKLLNQCELDG